MSDGAAGSFEGISEPRSIDVTRPNWMEIDLSALDHNFRLVRDMVGPEVRIIPCVKSAAYGLALPDISRRLVRLGAQAIFCGSFEDAQILRSAGLAETDLVVFGSTLPAGIPQLLKLDLIPTIHNMETAEAVSSSATRPARVYVKVDAGRGRLGLPIRTAEEAILRIARMPNVVIEGLYTHLPFTDAEGALWAQERTELFDGLVDRLRRKGLSAPVTQTRSSSGVLFGIRDRCNAVAPGSIIFGKPSLPEGMADASAFRLVLSAIRSRLIQVSPDAADRMPGLSARYAHRVIGATGVIPFGRKDGHPVARPGHTSFVIVKGAAAPVLSVSSEQAVVDLSAVSDPKVGDDVVILGRSGELKVTLADLARWQEVGMNDVLLAMRGRLPQIVHEG